MQIKRILNYWKKLFRLYEKNCAPVCQKYGINQSAFDVVLFLANNPEYNTARDICEVRGIKSGIASVVVDNLIRQGFLERRVDMQDRRKQRLFLTEKADGLVSDGQEAQQMFFAVLSEEITPEEQHTFEQVFEKMIQAVERMD